MSDVNWKSLPPLGGGVYVSMITEVLDDNGIPNLVHTDLAAGGLGVVTGTEWLGRAWRIQVPEADYDRALELFESLMGGQDQTEPPPAVE